MSAGNRDPEMFDADPLDSDEMYSTWLHERDEETRRDMDAASKPNFIAMVVRS